MHTTGKVLKVTIAMKEKSNSTRDFSDNQIEFTSKKLTLLTLFTYLK